ncbi:MAG: 1,4-alpha-glucan branching protein GlgB [Bdellovibrionota bacterium]
MKQQIGWLSDYEMHLFSEGTFYRSFERLGAHVVERNGVRGTQFCVWAPNARRVSVAGDFNNWDESSHPLESVGETGCWSGFIPGVGSGMNYKYAIYSNVQNYCALKLDPYAFHAETPPKSASVVWDIGGYDWNDSSWMERRKKLQDQSRPMSIYEVHLGSWRRKPEEGNRPLSYREVAEELVRYVVDMGFTHVEFLPLTEHPFTGSWGYQSVGYFAPTSRFGTPQDLMYLIDRLHQHDIGVIMDWVPGHFPVDGHALAFFDGTHLYEHEDRRQGFHPDWGTYIFNFGRREVTNFLISSAVFWLEKYHIDGLRVDAVASMLYLDYSRKEGEWIPNAYGGRENLEAIAFLKRLNEVVYERFPDTITVAEESTSWPMVSRPTYLGGLGFGFKWNMGWMHDILSYFSKDPIHRQFHHNNLSFGLLYAYHENFILPFSHDEVVHGKGSMIAKMAGDEWQKFANLRALYGLMFAYPGKKLLFMGCEFGQWSEWNADSSLDWHLLNHGMHSGLLQWVRDLNAIIRREPALHEVDFEYSGFKWIDCNDSAQSTLSFQRLSRSGDRTILGVFNFTPVPRFGYRLGVPNAGFWKEELNSDASIYGGSSLGNAGGVSSDPVSAHGHGDSICVTLPPLSAVYFSMS